VNRYALITSVVHAVLLCALFPLTATATPTEETYGPFDVTFHNNGDIFQSYTGDTDWTAEQQADVEAMIDMWDGYIGNPYGPRQIEFHLIWDELPGTTLGGSSSYYTGDNTTAWTFTERIWRTGTDPGTQSFDLYIVLDSGTSWNFGTGDPGVGEYDFRSVMAHEIGHAVGFNSTYELATPPSSPPDNWWAGGITEWDKHLRDDDSDMPEAGGKGTPHGFGETDNPVYFVGANAVAFNGGDVEIYAPNPYSGGSSLTHLDETVFPNALMSPMIGDEQVIRGPTLLELEMMKDMGWTIVPEPGSCAIFGIVLLSLVRRRSSTRS
jgi:hypothetical protein